MGLNFLLIIKPVELIHGVYENAYGTWSSLLAKLFR